MVYCIFYFLCYISVLLLLLLLLSAFQKLFLKILKHNFFFISVSKLRNMIYIAGFRFAAGIVLDEKLDFVLNDILHEQRKGKM